jgi:hypothetical protein
MQNRNSLTPPHILYVPPIPQQIQISVDQPYAGPAASCCGIIGTHSMYLVVFYVGEYGWVCIQNRKVQNSLRSNHVKIYFLFFGGRSVRHGSASGCFKNKTQSWTSPIRNSNYSNYLHILSKESSISSAAAAAAIGSSLVVSKLETTGRYLC